MWWSWVKIAIYLIGAAPSFIQGVKAIWKMIQDLLPHSEKSDATARLVQIVQKDKQARKLGLKTASQSELDGFRNELKARVV